MALERRKKKRMISAPETSIKKGSVTYIYSTKEWKGPETGTGSSIRLVSILYIKNFDMLLTNQPIYSRMQKRTPTRTT